MLCTELIWFGAGMEIKLFRAKTASSFPVYWPENNLFIFIRPAQRSTIRWEKKQGTIEKVRWCLVFVCLRGRKKVTRKRERERSVSERENEREESVCVWGGCWRRKRQSQVTPFFVIRHIAKARQETTEPSSSVIQSQILFFFPPPISFVPLCNSFRARPLHSVRWHLVVTLNMFIYSHSWNSFAVTTHSGVKLSLYISTVWLTLTKESFQSQMKYRKDIFCISVFCFVFL